MGDAGSHLLGFALATLALQSLSAPPLTFQHVAAVLVLLGYPLFDVLFVVVDRLSRGAPIHVGGIDHTTHRLGRTFGPWGVLGIVAGAAAISAALGTWIWGCSSLQQTVAVVLVLGLAYALFGVLLRRIGPTP